MVWKQGASPVYDQSNNAGRQREIRRREVVSMSVRRIMGTETEYAVSALGMEHYNPVKLSFDVVGAAANERTKHIRWDYRQEDPVNDARGTRLERASAHPDLLTDAPQLNITNVIAVNGGRVYVDHAHPEYSAPETDDPSMPCSTTMPAISSCVSARAKPANRPVSQSRCTVITSTAKVQAGAPTKII